MKKLTYFI